MKIIHLSDLHLGKRLNEFSLLEDQRYILDEIVRIVDREAPRAVLIAGDVYDKSVPSADAVQAFDDFLCKLAARKLQVFVISGNHDSPERIAFGAKLMDASGVHMSQVYDGNVEPTELSDEFGPVRFYLLPFIKPATARPHLCEEIENYTDALRAAISHMGIDPAVRNVLVAHQFVTGARTCESEDVNVGGLDNVDASAFDGFDYVALGHLHGPQDIPGHPGVRYCGTPLKYSFSEKDHVKSVTVVELGAKGSVEIRTVPLKPLRELREIRGACAELTLRANYEGAPTDDYLRVVLTDEQDVPGALSRLRDIYPHLMQLCYDNARTRSSAALERLDIVSRSSPLELFAKFYREQNGAPMSDVQREFCRKLFEEIGGAAL